jgi:predicted RNA binding protein YcfA (HicA-like mRNA interferase family)
VSPQSVVIATSPLDLIVDHQLLQPSNEAGLEIQKPYSLSSSALAQALSHLSGFFEARSGGSYGLYNHRAQNKSIIFVFPRARRGIDLKSSFVENYLRTLNLFWTPNSSFWFAHVSTLPTAYQAYVP